MRRPKKSKYKSVVSQSRSYALVIILLGIKPINSKAVACPPSIVTGKHVRTFASYEENEELFSDRNVFPKSCIIKMEKISEK